MTNSRRKFIKTSALAFGGLATAMSAKSYGRILGANERIGFAHAGLNSRVNAHLSALNTFKDQVDIVGLCDVDNRIFDKVKKRWSSIVPANVKCEEDFRKLLENKDIDAITIASPDHWHAPMAIMALQAGKDVYCEKPCSHNPQESLWLQQAQAKSGKVLQIGNQQRSAPTTIELIKKLREGVIGETYYAKTIYESWRGTIGTGKKVAVPSWLNWDLFQGPAPREDFRDNIVHYNWHWFQTWGTGEISNNGLHEMDVARWALGVDIPTEVTSSGGRFAFDDDWEFYDTQIATFKFAGNKMLNWEGRSCNGSSSYRDGAGRGTYIYGTTGSAYVDRAGYQIFDKSGKEIANQREGKGMEGTDTTGISGLDNFHFDNFLKCVKGQATPNSPIAEAVKSTLLCHLGNMAQKHNATLQIDPVTGKPNHKGAMKDWSREYEKGWKPVV